MADRLIKAGFPAADVQVWKLRQANDFHTLTRSIVGWDKAASAAVGPPRLLMVGRRSLRSLVPPYNDSPVLGVGTTMSWPLKEH